MRSSLILGLMVVLAALVIPAASDKGNDLTVEEERLWGSAAMQEGKVEGRGWIGPLFYNIAGASLGPISVETYSLHRYDQGRFYGPTTIEIFGTAQNNAHDLVGSENYSNGIMYLRVLVRYEDDEGNLKVAADFNQQHEPGTHEYRVTAIIPDDVKMVEGRSTVMIEISHYAAWNYASGTRVVAQMQYAKPAEPTPPVLPDPGTLVDYRDSVGETLNFRVTGATGGSVWGTDIYTDDSSLATAAVHAGLLHSGEEGVLTVTILPSKQSYAGSSRNDVTTSSWDEWPGSYTFVHR